MGRASDISDLLIIIESEMPLSKKEGAYVRDHGGNERDHEGNPCNQS
jgi:hypothetical protein